MPSTSSRSAKLRLTKFEPAQVMGGEHGNDGERQQTDDERLLFGSQQRDQFAVAPCFCSSFSISRIPSRCRKTSG